MLSVVMLSVQHLIVLNVIMLSAVMLSVQHLIVLNVIRLSDVMLGVPFFNWYAERYSAECRYAECHCALNTP